MRDKYGRDILSESVKDGVRYTAKDGSMSIGLPAIDDDIAVAKFNENPPPAFQKIETSNSEDGERLIQTITALSDEQKSRLKAELAAVMT